MMLSAFGLFGQTKALALIGGDAAILAFVVLFLAVTFHLVALLEPESQRTHMITAIID